MADGTACALCEPGVAERLDVVMLWDSSHWRGYVMRAGPSPGFCLLSLRRHAPSLAQLDEEEARDLGPALVRLTRHLDTAVNPDRAYVYGFGDHVPHAHLGVAPHVEGDELLGSAGVARADAADGGRFAQALTRILADGEHRTATSGRDRAHD